MDYKNQIFHKFMRKMGYKSPRSISLLLQYNNQEVMEKEEVIKNNILISEFLSRRGKIRKDLFWINGISGHISGLAWFKTNESKYHSSWDWLMPVVEKIETMGYQVDLLSRKLPIELSATDKDHTCLIWNDEHTVKVTEVGSVISKHDAAYNGVIDFIKWYNKNNKDG